jgi:hypothetical protein
MRTRIWRVFSIAGGAILALAGLAYFSSRRPADLAFHFLAGHEPWHRGTHDTSSGMQSTTVYCFPAYHDSICYTASKELSALGYREVSAPIDYGTGDYRFDPRYRTIPSKFRKEGRTSLSICINKGRFLEERGGNLSFSRELDWVNVVIRQTRLPFSLGRELRYWYDKLFQRNRI